MHILKRNPNDFSLTLVLQIIKTAMLAYELKLHSVWDFYSTFNLNSKKYLGVIYWKPIDFLYLPIKSTFTLLVHFSCLIF